MLNHGTREVQSAALRVLASQAFASCPPNWETPLKQLLASNLSPLLLDALKKLRAPIFDQDLQAIAADPKRPMPIRLKALDATKNAKITGELLEMLKGILSDGAASPASKIQAAVMLAAAPLQKDQIVSCAPILRSAGPIELKTLLPLISKSKEANVGQALAEALSANPAFTSLQESLYRTAFSGYPPAIFEQHIHPALAKASELEAAKMRRLAPLSEKVSTSGSAQRGKALFESGKGTCIVCHKVGQLGRSIGPDLSTIGAIRTSRDLLESILFPSNTLARDYEAHIIETKDGQQTIGVIRSHTAEGLLVVDLAGQEKNIRHDSITGNTTLTTSLMPSGLESTLSESELLDLVAWLASLH
jgi:putative heme-binding domain-containing protein